MAYDDPQNTHDPATNTIAPAAWGDVVRDDLQWLATDKPHVRVRSQVAQSIPTGTWTALLFQVEVYDVGAMHSTVTNTSRLTVPTGGAGVYDMGCSLNFAVSAGGVRRLARINRNGSDFQASVTGFPDNSISVPLSLYATNYCAAADYIEVEVYQDTGGALSTEVIAMNPWFAMRWVAV